MSFWGPVICGAVAYVAILLFAARMVSHKWHPDGGEPEWHEEHADQQ